MSTGDAAHEVEQRIIGIFMPRQFDDCVWLPVEQIEVDGHVVVTHVLPDNGSELVLLNERTCETWPCDRGY